MKYTKPELTANGSALALVQSQSAATKGTQFVDRADLQPIGPLNNVSDPAAYEADE